MSRVARVRRTTRRRLIAGSSPRCGQPSQLGSDAAFAADHRTSCSRRRSSDWSSVARNRRAVASCRPRSIQPRLGPADRKLRERRPARVERREQQLEHGRLVPVADGAGRCSGRACVEVCTERRGEALVRLAARVPPCPARSVARKRRSTPDSRASCARATPASSRRRRRSSARVWWRLRGGSRDGLLERRGRHRPSEAGAAHSGGLRASRGDGCEASGGLGGHGYAVAEAPDLGLVVTKGGPRPGT